MAHDIIDNRNEKLVDHIKRILGSTEAARFVCRCVVSVRDWVFEARCPGSSPGERGPG